jgi:DNA mismatch endonuclease Vsr
MFLRQRSAASICREYEAATLGLKWLSGQSFIGWLSVSITQKGSSGKPDVVLVRHRKIIDVHGCFFHMHKCKYGSVVPATNASFWKTKRLSNVERDRRNLRTLRRDGWDVLIVWECETKNPIALQADFTDSSIAEG